MFEALYSSKDYIFNVLKLHRIIANYLPRNRRSGALLERLGFEIEGEAKELLKINGVWEDHVMTSLINPRS
jgi:ribosomal-protein-alanine N-acetyltransferase